MTRERAEQIGCPQGVAVCPKCGASQPIHEGYLNAPCPEADCDGTLSDSDIVVVTDSDEIIASDPYLRLRSEVE